MREKRMLMVDEEQLYNQDSGTVIMRLEIRLGQLACYIDVRSLFLPSIGAGCQRRASWGYDTR